MGYEVRVRSHPHDSDPPTYFEDAEVDNVDTVQIPDDGPEARLLHELLGMVMTRGESLDSKEAADLHESLERRRKEIGELKKEVEREKTSAPIDSPLRSDDAAE